MGDVTDEGVGRGVSAVCVESGLRGGEAIGLRGKIYFP